MRNRFKRIGKRLQRDHQARVVVLRRLRRHPIMLPVLTFFVLSIVSAVAILLINHGTPKFHPISSYIVIVSHDHLEETVPTREPTVGALLEKFQIKLNTGDIVEPSTATPITQDNFHINVYRAVPVEIINGDQ